MADQTAITQIHYYIKEHFKTGDSINTSDILAKLTWLTPSSISASLWKFKEEGMLEKTGRQGLCNQYTVLSEIFCKRDTEDMTPCKQGIRRRGCHGKRNLEAKPKSEMPSEDRRIMDRRIEYLDPDRRISSICSEINMYQEEISKLVKELMLIKS